VALLNSSSLYIDHIGQKLSVFLYFDAIPNIVRAPSQNVLDQLNLRPFLTVKRLGKLVLHNKGRALVPLLIFLLEKLSLREICIGKLLH
jgi:hypothetical protein